MLLATCVWMDVKKREKKSHQANSRGTPLKCLWFRRGDW
jgi:hypothetical protein